jgi:hypothetical protein
MTAATIAHLDPDLDMPATLAAAMAKLQTRLPKIFKGNTATIKNEKANYSYQYADLSDISERLLPVMGEVGLSFIAMPTYVGERFVLEYELLHVSGESRKGIFPLPTAGGPQAVGSAITYARRYCLCAVSGIVPDSDDDGQAAQAAHGGSTRIENFEDAAPVRPVGPTPVQKAAYDLSSKEIAGSQSQVGLAKVWDSIIARGKSGELHASHFPLLKQEYDSEMATITGGAR